MKNRAKCKKCNSIIESFHDTDYVNCKCGEISVSGGVAMYCAAFDWVNFMRVDEFGNEIVTKIKDETSSTIETPTHKPNKKDLISMLDEMIKSYEKLPQQAMSNPVTHYDLVSALMLVSEIFRCDLKEES